MKKLNKKNIEDIIALTPMQEGMLYHFLTDLNSDLYFEQLSINIFGQFDIERFEQAWNFVIEKNEMLRTVFRWEKLDKPIQIVLKEYKLQPQYYGFIDRDTVDVEVEVNDEKRKNKKKNWIEEIKTNDRKKKFDLKEVPFRVTLCFIKKDRYEMIVSHHHILYDGWSNGIILKEFFEAYDELYKKNPLIIPTKTKFKEFVKWLQNRDINKEKKFWENYLKRFDTKTGVPVKRKKGKEIRSTENYQKTFPGEITVKLEPFIKRYNITIASLLYSAWGILLQQYYSTDDVFFDTTVSGRSAKIKGIEKIVGLFINTLPLRMQSDPDEKISNFLSRIYFSLQMWGEYENSSLASLGINIDEYSGEYLNENRFDSVVVIENYPVDRILMQENNTLSVHSFSIYGRTHYDLTVIVTTFDQIKVDVTYNKELFDEKSLLMLLDHFTGIIHYILDNPGKKVSEIGGIFRGDKNRLFTALNGTAVEATGSQYPYAAPRNETEEKLVEIWSVLLRVNKAVVGIDMNFFDFGGHSLKAAVLAAKIHKEFNVKVPVAEIFNRSTIRELAVYINDSKETKYASIEAAEKRDYYPLSSAQTRLYFLQQMEPKSIAYNGPLVMLLEGEMKGNHLSTMKKTFGALIKRHESLRTSFVSIDGKPFQKIHKTVNFIIEDYIPKGAGEQRELAPLNNRALSPSDVINHFIRPFDLTQAPLLRVGLYRLPGLGIEEKKHLLMIDMHHIVTDGTSLDILIKEFNTLYRGDKLPELKDQYKDFSQWQNHRLTSGQLKQQESHWMQQFSGSIPVLNMPLDYPRPFHQSFKGDKIDFHLGNEWKIKSDELQRKTGTTLYMVLLTAYYILLGNYTGQKDITIGSTTAGRDHTDLQDIIGLLLETLALRNYPEDDKTLITFLKEVKESTLKAYDNQAYPFRELIKQVADENELSRNPLFDAMLIVQNIDTAEMEIEGIKSSLYPVDVGIAKVDMTIEAVEIEDGIDFTLEYNTALFKQETMERLAVHYMNILKELAVTVEKPEKLERKLSAINIMEKKEKQQILEVFNDTGVDYCKEKLVHELFEDQVEKTPDHIAVIAQSTEHIMHGGPGIVPGKPPAPCSMMIALTYRKLNEQSNQLARILMDKDVKPDNIVGIMVHPSVEMIVGLLGILKSGGAYLPIIPDYPEERKVYLLKDSGAEVLVTTRTHPNLSERIMFGREMIYLDTQHKDKDKVKEENTNLSPQTHPESFKIPLNLGPENLAYVIYTSGSTGRPKGVMVKHKNLMAYLYSFEQEFEITDQDVVLQQASFSFDAFAEEVFPCLLKGGCIAALSKDDVRDMALLSRFICRSKISIIDCSPLLLNQLDKGLPKDGKNPLHSIHTFISGGDVLKNEYIGHLLKIGDVYNTYGPTETTICATYHKCKGKRNGQLTVPIGKPISNWKVVIRSNKNKLQPIGVAGEISICGDGVTRGYLNQPELTKEKFVENPWFPGEIMYKTGDLGKWLPDGSIEFLGRMDRQVNIRGYRIELEEIENRLLDHEEIDKATVVAMGSSSLCAYFTSPKEKTARELRHFLSIRLPDYMIPAYFVQLERMPLTTSGKIDRKALPNPGENSVCTGAEYAPPGSEAEKKLIEIWQEILGIERIGIDHDFFELGGDSLSANQSIARIRAEMHVEVSLKNFFEHSTIRSLSKRLGKRKAEISLIEKVSRDQPVPLSFAQEGLWFLQQLDNESMAYHVPRAIRIKGSLEVSLFERTFTRIISRHEILRTVFPTIDGEPTQKILPPYELKIAVIDLTGLGSEEQSRKVSQLIMEEGQRGFDFEKGPMLRLKLLKLKEDEHILVSIEHHLIHDGWTQGVMLKEFIAIYTAFFEGKPPPLNELPIQYADYACWQKKYLKGDILAHRLNYWKEKLSGLPPIMELPLDRPRPPVISGRGAMKRLVLPDTLFRSLKEFSRKRGVTLFMTMLAVFKVLLFRYTYSEKGDLCVGTGIANRKYKETEGMLGMIINTIPLRTCITGEMTFGECVDKVKATCLEAYEHEDTPFEKVVEVIQPTRSLSYNPIFQVLFSFMDTPMEHLSLPGLDLSVESSHNRSSKFDMNIVLILPLEVEGESEGNDVIIDWEYNTDIFDGTTIDRMLMHYKNLLRESVINPKERISLLQMLEKSETAQLLFDFNDTNTEYPADRAIHELFEEQAKKIPDHMAIVSDEKDIENRESYWAISYRELSNMSNQMAGLLRGKGVRGGTVVGIMAKRSIGTIVGILGILKTGGVYLPIDHGYPEERKKYILKDSNLKLLLTDIEDSMLPGLEVVNLNDKNIYDFTSAVEAEFPPNHLSYIMYTSGSTGTPKGVMVEHRSVVRLVKNTNYITFKKDDRILQTGALEFDASTFEIWGSLLNGLTLYLASKDKILIPEVLKKIIVENKITTMWMTSPLFNRMVQNDVDIFKGLRNLLVGGDVLSPVHIERLRKCFPLLNIINGYGPTENTTFSTTFLIDKEYKDSIPIGKPIANSSAYILNKSNHLQPIGVAGELCVGGNGLARGYLNNPERTAEKFDHDFKDYQDYQDKKGPAARGSFRIMAEEYNPTHPTQSLTHSTIYKTGDLARWLPCGNIEFLGRIDRQVKIRGFRIEPEEIENQLLNLEEIEEAVVVAREEESGEKCLCAYIVNAGAFDKLPNSTALREYLSEELPDYMIPSYFVWLEKMPLTSNGKVDRKVLPEPKISLDQEYKAPRNKIEETMIEIWAEVLDLEKEKIGIHSNFFDLGGHSLKAAVMVSKIHKKYNVKIPLARIFEIPFIKGLSQYIMDAEQQEYLSIKPVEKKEYYPLSSTQARVYFQQSIEPDSISYNIPNVIILEGELNKERMEKAFRMLINRHESLRTSIQLIEGMPVQKILEKVGFRIQFYDLTRTQVKIKVDVEREIDNASLHHFPLMEQTFHIIRPFDLSQAPLVRVGLIKKGESIHILIIDMHHIISDGTSMGIFEKEFVTLYKEEALPQLKIQYKDFSRWQNHRTQCKSINKQEYYWMKQFEGDIPVLNLPTDFPRPEVMSFEGERIFFEIGKELTVDINRMVSETGATLYMVLLAAYNVLLSKYTGQEDIIVGTPTVGRQHPEVENIFGMFLNILAVRNHPERDKTFTEFTEEVKMNSLKAYENQDFQFDKLVEKLDIKRNSQRHPLLDTIFLLQNYSKPVVEIHNLKLIPYKLDTAIAKFDITFEAEERAEGINFKLEYRTKLFEKETIERMAEDYIRILRVVTRNGDIKIKEIELDSEIIALKKVCMNAEFNI